MRRREFIQIIAGSAASWPLAARAQQPEQMHRIGYLTLLSGPSQSSEGFQQCLCGDSIAKSGDMVREPRGVVSHSRQER